MDWWAWLLVGVGGALILLLSFLCFRRYQHNRTKDGGGDDPTNEGFDTNVYDIDEYTDPTQLNDAYSPSPLLPPLETRAISDGDNDNGFSNSLDFQTQLDSSVANNVRDIEQNLSHNLFAAEEEGNVGEDGSFEDGDDDEYDEQTYPQNGEIEYIDDGDEEERGFENDNEDSGTYEVEEETLTTDYTDGMSSRGGATY